MHDVQTFGPKKAAEVALEMAWEGCKAVYLSFDMTRSTLDLHRVPALPSPADFCRAKPSR